ncbi:MAG: sterol desaturase family protein [Gammaproteobacteria bacterium]|nr:sterol desaturase family protein [Gammaproteobacteria bacterium]
MTEWILTHEDGLRLGCFLGVFALVAFAETRLPSRTLQIGKRTRWINNLVLVAVNTLAIRLIFPAAAVGAAALAEDRGWGLFHALNIPLEVAAPLSVVLLDLAIYLQHVMFHAVPLLWRLHRVHHTDLDYDVTTGARFHPIEIVLSMLIKYAVIFLLGAPIVAVVVFEILLNATAMFNHGNLRLPKRLDAVLRLVVVTPDMHRVHHSTAPDETNSNFGFNLPWWDHLFGTYRAQPRGGHQGMEIGIEGYRDPAQVQRLAGMLMLPFRRAIGEYAINRRPWK